MLKTVKLNNLLLLLLLLLGGCIKEVISDKKNIVYTILGWNINHYLSYNPQNMDYIGLDIMINNHSDDTLFISNKNSLGYLYTYSDIKSHINDIRYNTEYTNDTIHFTLSLMDDYKISPKQKQIIKLKVEINNFKGYSLADSYDFYSSYFRDEYKIITNGIISEEKIVIQKDSNYITNFFLDEDSVYENSDLLFW
jgi:hypothetical protein